MLLQMFCVFSKQISQVGYCQHGGLRVLHGRGGVTRMKTNRFHSSFPSPELLGFIKRSVFCESHLFSAVFSIACILSSIVDLIRNL